MDNLAFLAVLGNEKQTQSKSILFSPQHCWGFEKTNRAPSEAGAIQQVLILPGQRLADRPECKRAYQEVTNGAKPY